MIALNNEQAVKKSRVIRNTLIELRISGLTLKQAAAIVGITIATADWHWGKIRKLCGGATEGAIAAWAATTPRHLWIPVLMLVLCACKTQPVQQPAKPMLTPPIPQATVRPRAKAIVVTPPRTNIVLFIPPPNAADALSVDMLSSTNGGTTWTVIGEYGPWAGVENIVDVKASSPSELFRLRFNMGSDYDWIQSLPKDWTAGKEGPQ